MRHLLPLLCATLCLPLTAADYVWWEGEAATEDNFAEQTGFDASTFEPIRHEVLSGGDWLTNGGDRGADEPEAFARYTVEVPVAGTYQFWTRKFWKHGPFRWRFDDAEWTEVGKNISLADSTYIRLHLGANWVYLGEVELEAGAHDFELRLLAEPGQGKTACFDAFLLTQQPFAPRGRLKPDEKSGAADPGFFAWEPDADPLDDDAPIDLRFLNEDVAGEHGFIRREGNKLVRGDGEEIRFWSVQANLGEMDDAQIDWWAKRLAKYGVNMVRLHAQVWDRKADDPSSINEHHLDRLHYVVAALKKEGIYSYFGHVYWANWNITDKQFPGYGGGNGKAPHGLLEISPEWRQVYLKWAEAILTRENPYTGIPLGQDPALAVYEVQNEDSLLFWASNFERMPENVRDMAERQFYAMAVERYGSEEAALEAWGGVTHQRDVHGQRFGLFGTWDLTTDGLKQKSAQKARAGDQLRYMVETQKAAYEEIIAAIRDDFGAKNAIACSNWKTADSRLMDTLERYSYSPGDVLCRNEYFGVDYDPKPKRFYAVDVDDTFKDGSCLTQPTKAPFALHQYADYPDLVTENCWNRPSRYRSEFPFLISTFARAAGYDGWNFFALQSSVWNSQMSVWSINDPSVMGQFPAAALVYRRGDVAENPVVLREALTLDGQYAFEGTAAQLAQGLDELWQQKVGADKVQQVDKLAAVDPLLFLVGQAERALGDGTDGFVTNVSELIDHEAKQLTSASGELRWDYGTGVATVDTATAQGATGFLAKAGAIALGDIAIAAGNDYGTLMVVSLDGEPLASSKTILVQVGTEDRPFGFETEETGNGFRRITDLGGYPMNVKLVDCAVTIKGAAGATVTALDGNGYRSDKAVETAAAGKDLTITLPSDGLYVLVER